MLVGLRARHLRTPILLADLYQSGQHVEAADEAMRVIDAFEDRLKFQVINLPFSWLITPETSLSVLFPCLLARAHHKKPP